MSLPSFIAITNALADSHRVRALLALRHGEMCVCRIVELLGLAPSTVSKHMAILRQAGLVQSRKQGRWIYYTLADKTDPTAAAFIALTQTLLEHDDTVAADWKRTAAILKQTPESLCRKQRV